MTQGRNRTRPSMEWAQSLHPVDRLLFVAQNRDKMKSLMAIGRRGNEVAAREARMLQRKIAACRKAAKGERK